jgi:F0F1-type ATP synthase beta subunit
MKQTKTTDGRVIAVRSAVLDIAFEAARLPPIEDAVRVTPDKGGAAVHAAGGPLQVPGKLTAFLRRR